MVMDVDIDLHNLFGEPQYIPIDKCVTGLAEARQTGTEVKEDDELVDSIRRMGGIMQPVILHDLKNGQYEIVVGQRRVGAYCILKDEDSKFEKILAHVAKRDLTNEEKKIISFVECSGRKPMTKVDYSNVIEYFYKKYGRSITQAAKALGISTGTAKKYLVTARLSDKVRNCIEKKEFSIDIAMKALMALGDYEESVDDDVLIKVAKELKNFLPSRRMEIVKKIRKNPEMTVEEANEKILTTTVLQFELTSDSLDMIEKYRVRKGFETKEEAVIDAMDEGLFAAMDE
jgi:ParB/RepB/Spo0J family partition protein